jgi:hypothetical protein
MKQRKAVRELIAYVEALGMSATFAHGNSGHDRLVIENADGKSRFVVMSRTPSCRNSMMNIKTSIRKEVRRLSNGEPKH